MDKHNLFADLQASFPKDLDTCAIETVEPEGQPGLRYSWRDIDRSSAMLANLLASLGFPKGSRIALQVDKSVEALMLCLATLRAGHVWVPLNAVWQGAEIAFCVGDAKPAVMVCSKRNFGWVSKLAFVAGTRYVFTLDADRSGSLLERAAFCSDRQTPVPCSADDLAVIAYSSGATGCSKGVMLSHGSMRAIAQVMRDQWDWRPGDRLVHALPMFHLHGLLVAIQGALVNGNSLLWLNRIDPSAVVSLLPRATVLAGVPTLYARLLEELTENHTQAIHMRLFVSGAVPLPIETSSAWKARTGHPIQDCFSLCESIQPPS